MPSARRSLNCHADKSAVLFVHKNLREREKWKFYKYKNSIERAEGEIIHVARHIYIAQHEKHEFFFLFFFFSSLSPQKKEILIKLTSIAIVHSMWR